MAGIAELIRRKKLARLVDLWMRHGTILLCYTEMGTLTTLRKCRIKLFDFELLESKSCNHIKFYHPILGRFIREQSYISGYNPVGTTYDPRLKVFYSRNLPTYLLNICMYARTAAMMRRTPMKTT